MSFVGSLYWNGLRPMLRGFVLCRILAKDWLWVSREKLRFWDRKIITCVNRWTDDSTHHMMSKFTKRDILSPLSWISFYVICEIRYVLNDLSSNYRNCVSVFSNSLLTTLTFMYFNCHWSQMIAKYIKVEIISWVKLELICIVSYSPTILGAKVEISATL